MSYVYASQRQTGRTPQAPKRQAGAWKLAYADFLTALCAFFLIMWIVHGISADKRSELAQQFSSTPAQVSDHTAHPVRAAEALAWLTNSKFDFAQSANVILKIEDSSLRIELVDSSNRPLFEKGAASLNEYGLSVTARTAQAISALRKPISIEGHTDSDPITRPKYSNWDLSTDRGNAARRALIASGLAPNLITSVTGLADTRPLYPEAPYLPQNRRLSIVVHFE